MMFNCQVLSFCNMYVGQETEQRDAKEVHVLPFHHLNGAVLVQHNHLTKITHQLFLPCSLYDVPLKKSNMTAFRLVLDFDHLRGLCFLAITATLQNHQTKPKPNLLHKKCFPRHSCDQQEHPFVLDSIPIISPSLSSSGIVTICRIIVYNMISP
jgi:hypothetical protein